MVTHGDDDDNDDAKQINWNEIILGRKEMLDLILWVFAFCFFF